VGTPTAALSAALEAGTEAAHPLIVPKLPRIARHCGYLSTGVAQWVASALINELRSCPDLGAPAAFEWWLIDAHPPSTGQLGLIWLVCGSDPPQLRWSSTTPLPIGRRQVPPL